MIVKNGDILEVMNQSEYAVAHGVNCQGKMASGVAGLIAHKQPRVKSKYLDLFAGCKGGNPDLLGHSQEVMLSPNQVVYNCFTQEYYGRDGKQYADLEAITKSLTSSLLLASGLFFKELHIPMIGAGLGGLSAVECLQAFIKADESTDACELIVLVHGS